MDTKKEICQETNSKYNKIHETYSSLPKMGYKPNENIMAERQK